MLCSVIICSFSFATYVYGACGIILLFVYSEWCHGKIYIYGAYLNLWLYSNLGKIKVYYPLLFMLYFLLKGTSHFHFMCMASLQTDYM